MPDVFTRSGASLTREVEVARAGGVVYVNDAIGRARRAYITDQPGQEAIYNAKEAEAVAYQYDPSPPADLANGGYPFLAAEAGVTAVDAAALAALWLTMAGQWRAIAAQLEGLRLGAITQIEAASTPQEVDAAIAAFDVAMGQN